MRCFVDLSNDFQLKDYMIFLEDVFEISFILKFYKAPFICLESKENKYKSFLLIRGENYNVISLLSNIPIFEKKIILITCTATSVIDLAKRLNRGLTKNKMLFYPTEQIGEKLLPVYCGEDFGIGFDPCKSEYLLGRYSHRKGVYECLDLFFYKKKIKEC